MRYYYKGGGEALLHMLFLKWDVMGKYKWGVHNSTQVLAAKIEDIAADVGCALWYLLLGMGYIR